MVIRWCVLCVFALAKMGPTVRDEFVTSLGWVGISWVQVLIKLSIGNEQLQHDSATDVLEIHRSISIRIATHLQLTLENIVRLLGTAYNVVY